MRSEPYPVPTSLHLVNRQKLCARLKEAGAPAKALVLLEGGKEEYRHETDTEKLFRQESSFHYLFGAKEPNCYGTIEVQSGKATLYIPRLGEEYAVWMGFIQPPSYFKVRERRLVTSASAGESIVFSMSRRQELYGVDEVLFVDELAATLKAYGPDVLYLNQGLNTDSGSMAKPATFEGMEEEGFKTDTKLLYPSLAECRVIKTPEELRLLQYVNDISSEAHFEVGR